MTQQLTTTPDHPDHPRAAPGARPTTEPDHARLGVGARFTLSPAIDDAVPVILGALAAAAHAAPDVAVRTDDVSTLLRGAEQDLAVYLEAAIRGAARRTPSGHVTASLALSRGCPGAVGCDVRADELVAVPPVRLAPSGVVAAAHWALYPLGVADTMDPIAAAIEGAREAGTWAGAEHYATRLEGDLAAVLATFVDTWAAVGRSVAHVAAHVTITVGGPNRAAGTRP